MGVILKLKENWKKNKEKRQRFWSGATADEKRRKKDLNKSIRKIEKIKGRLAKTEEKGKKADTRYQKRLDKELARDKKKGLKSGTTTKKRRKRAKTAQKVVGNVVGLSGTAGLAKGLIHPTAKAGIGAVKIMTGHALTGTNRNPKKRHEGGTIFEPRLVRKTLLSRKKSRLKGQLEKKEKRLKNITE